MSLDLEPIEANIEASLQAMTVGAGYNLPKNLGLVTREILDYDETIGKRPAAIIQITQVLSTLIGTGGVAHSTVHGRVIFYFDLDTGPMRAGTWANRYKTAARDALLLDRSRGGHPGVLTTTITEEPTSLLWKMGQAFEVTIIFEILVRHEGGA